MLHLANMFALYREVIMSQLLQMSCCRLIVQSDIVTTISRDWLEKFWIKLTENIYCPTI